VFVQQNVRYPKQEPISSLRSSQYSPAPELRQMLFTSSHKLSVLCCQLSCPSLVHNQLPATSFLLLYLTVLSAIFCQLCKFLASTWKKKNVFSHVIKAMPKHLDHFQARFIQHLLRLPTDIVSLKSSSALTVWTESIQRLSACNSCLSINRFIKVQVSSALDFASPYSKASFPSVIAGSNLPYGWSFSLKKLPPQKKQKGEILEQTLA